MPIVIYWEYQATRTIRHATTNLKSIPKAKREAAVKHTIRIPDRAFWKPGFYLPAWLREKGLLQ